MVTWSLSGETPRRLAMINGRRFGTGESATLKLDGRPVVIRCVSITQDAATIAVEGTTGTKSCTCAKRNDAVEHEVTEGTETRNGPVSSAAIRFVQAWAVSERDRKLTLLEEEL